MAVQAKIKMLPTSKAGNDFFSAPQKSSATFVEGAPVKLSSGNLVAVSTANKSSTTHLKVSSTNNIVGIACGTAVASNTDNLVVAKWQEGAEFIGNLVHTNGASSAKVSKIGSTVYVGKDKSSDTHYGWSLTAPSSATSVVQDIITRLVDAASTANGRVVATVTKGGALSAF